VNNKSILLYKVNIELNMIGQYLEHKQKGFYSILENFLNAALGKLLLKLVQVGIIEYL